MGIKFDDLNREGAQLASDAVIVNGTALTPQFIKIAVTTSGEIVPAVATKKIRVLQYNFMAAATCNVKWVSAGTDISGNSFLIPNVGKVCGFSPVGWLETNAGQALNINLSAAASLGGELVYITV